MTTLSLKILNLVFLLMVPSVTIHPAIFPNFETTMFNLYETLIDIKLFFKDLLQ